MYIYESHMGGVFATDEVLDFDQCYCEECGDSDYLIGQANTVDEAWTLLKDNTYTFDESICRKCSHLKDYDYCNNKCEHYSHASGFDYSYICKFIYENFEVKNKAYCVLISKHINCDNMILVNCKPIGHSFGECYSIPMTPILLDDSLSNEFKANSLLSYVEEYKENSLKEVLTKDIDGVKYIFFTCLSEEEGESWIEGAHYSEDGWYGYMDLNEIEQKFFNKQLFEVIKEIAFS